MTLPRSLPRLLSRRPLGHPGPVLRAAVLAGLLGVAACAPEGGAEDWWALPGGWVEAADCRLPAPWLALGGPGMEGGAGLVPFDPWGLSDVPEGPVGGGAGPVTPIRLGGWSPSEPTPAGPAPLGPTTGAAWTGEGWPGGSPIAAADPPADVLPLDGWLAAQDGAPAGGDPASGPGTTRRPSPAPPFGIAEPATMALVGGALVALALFRRPRTAEDPSSN